MAQIEDVTIDAVKQGLADRSILLVDVREPDEFAAAHIPGAVSVPLSTFDPAAIHPAPGQSVVFSCRSGGRTLKAIAASLQAGFPYARHYKGSMNEWLVMGEPVEAG